MGGKVSRRRQVGIALVVAVVVFAVDMWLEGEPDWPHAVWKVVDPIENLLILPVTIAAKFWDIGGIWFELHALSAVLWGIAFAWLITWRANRTQTVGKT